MGSQTGEAPGQARSPELTITNHSRPEEARGGLFGTTQARREFGGQIPFTEHVSIDNAAENAADTTRNFMHFLNCKFPIVQKTKQEIRSGNRWRRSGLGNVFQARNDDGVDLDGSHES
jgi:hypothetical protein